LTVLIIGLGSVGKKHIAAIRKVAPETVVYALRSSKNATVYEGLKNIYSLDELVEKPDFVVISNPTSLHKETLEEALKLACPVFMEKPVFADAEQVSQLMKELVSKQLITYVACNMRFHPAIEFLRKYLGETKPVVNEVNIYCGSYLPDWRPGTDFRKSYSASAAMGGGAHLDLIHEIDYCTWLFGMPAEVNAVRTNTSSLQINSVDCARFHFMYKNFTAAITLNYYRRDAKREIEIVTEDDTIVADLLQNTVTSLVSGKVMYEEVFTMQTTYEKQMSYFIDHINQHKQPMNGIEEGVRVLKLALHG
jgi:predicted dehydrogenase